MSRTSDAAFLARRALRTVRVVYGGAEGRASFKQGEVWIEDSNGDRTLEMHSTLLFDTALATQLSLAERTDIRVYGVDDANGTPVTYRIRQLRTEQDGLYLRAVIAK